MTEILQIVPRLPPAIDGVGDYAFLLARQLRAAHGVNTHFVVCDTGWKPEDGGRTTEDGLRTSDIRYPTSDIRLDGFPVHQLRERSAAELLRVLNQPGMPTTVLLQYVGYGYERRGCPLWLVRGLDKWRKQKAENRNQNQDSRKQKTEIKNDEGRDTFQLSQFPISALPNLVTMFHELYAFGPVWRSSFWTSPVQRWIAKSLAQLSDGCVTNLRRNVPVLRRMTGRGVADFTVLPVFSNVGEPEVLPEWDERPPRMIVFGSAGQRRQVYEGHRAELEQACRAMNLEEIVDIGAPLEIPPLAVPVLQRGILSATEVSREMLNGRAGFFAYPAAYLGKSTIFAAYAAHGLVPITFSSNVMENEDGLKAGEHFITPSSFSGHIQKIGAKANEWYLTHSVEYHANSYKQCMSYES